MAMQCLGAISGLDRHKMFQQALSNGKMRLQLIQLRSVTATYGPPASGGTPRPGDQRSFFDKLTGDHLAMIELPLVPLVASM